MTNELKELYEWRGEITSEQKALAVEQRALKELFTVKIDTVHDKLDTVNNTILQHCEDDRKNFDNVQNRLSNGDKQFSNLKRDITRLVTIGGIILVVAGWIANALIQRYVS